MAKKAILLFLARLTRQLSCVFRAFAQFKIAASKLTAIACRQDGSAARIYGDYGPGEVGL
jgi:hypothetical protein